MCLPPVANLIRSQSTYICIAEALWISALCSNNTPPSGMVIAKIRLQTHARKYFVYVAKSSKSKTLANYHSSMGYGGATTERQLFLEHDISMLLTFSPGIYT